MTEIILYLSHDYTHETKPQETLTYKAMNELLQNPENKLAAKSLGLSSLIWTMLILLGIVFLQTASAEDGAALHEENCIACHAAMTGGEGSVLYARADRAVKSSDALTKQVNRCQSSLGLGWSNAQTNSVQQYLNQSFYKF